MTRLKALSRHQATGKTKELFTAIYGELGMLTRWRPGRAKAEKYDSYAHQTISAIHKK